MFFEKMEGKKVTYNDHFAVFTSITKDTYINKKCQSFRTKS